MEVTPSLDNALEQEHCDVLLSALLSDQDRVQGSNFLGKVSAENPLNKGTEGGT